MGKRDRELLIRIQNLEDSARRLRRALVFTVCCFMFIIASILLTQDGIIMDTKKLDGVTFAPRLTITKGVDIASVSIKNSHFILDKADATTAAELRFLETDATPPGGNYVGFRAPASIAANTIWTLPAADGAPGNFLSTNGSGTLSWASASSSTAPRIHIAFTRTGVATTGTDAAKDAQVTTDLGSGFRAATPLDVAANFSYMQPPATFRFTVAGSTNAWRITAPTNAGGPLVLSEDPPPPPGELPPSLPVAAISKDAPIAFTRAAIASDSTTATKDSAVTTLMGTGYQAATQGDVAAAFRYCAPPATIRFCLIGSARTWRAISSSTPGNPLILSEDPPAPPGELAPSVVVAGIRK